jgi:hypothetical protein
MTRQRTASLFALSVCLSFCSVAVAQEPAPTITIDAGSPTCTGPGSATQIQCYVDSATLAVTWSGIPTCRLPNCHVEYCITGTELPNGSGHLPCAHEWEHKKPAETLNLPSNSATYPIYGEYRLKQTAEDGTDTSTLSTASSPFYVARLRQPSS